MVAMKAMKAQAMKRALDAQDVVTAAKEETTATGNYDLKKPLPQRKRHCQVKYTADFPPPAPRSRQVKYTEDFPPPVPMEDELEIIMDEMDELDQDELEDRASVLARWNSAENRLQRANNWEEFQSSQREAMRQWKAEVAEERKRQQFQA